MNDKLKKIINLAKKGEKGERENAIIIIKNICKNKGLSFDEVMNLDQDEEKEFSLEYRGFFPKKVACQLTFKITNLREIQYTSYCVFFKCTKQKFEELKIAFDEYRRIYKKERANLLKKHKLESRLFSDSFVERYDLFSQLSEEEIEELRKKQKEKKITKEDIKKAEMMSTMSRDMEEEPQLYKRLN